VQKIVKRDECDSDEDDGNFFGILGLEWHSMLVDIDLSIAAAAAAAAVSGVIRFFHSPKQPLPSPSSSSSSSSLLLQAIHPS